MRKTLAQFYNILMKFRRDLRSPLFLSVTNLMDMLFEISFAGKVCAFMLPFEHVHSCVRFKKNKKQAFGQAFPPQCTPSPPPPHTHTPRIWRHRPYHILNYAFYDFPKVPFTTMLLLVFFGCWEWMTEGGGWFLGRVGGWILPLLLHAFSMGEAMPVAVNRHNQYL